MFEPVLRSRSFGLISDYVGEPQSPEDIAYARYAPASGFGDLARVHLLAFSQQADHREGNGISQEPAQPRLPVAHLFHSGDVYHVFAIAKT